MSDFNDADTIAALAVKANAAQVLKTDDGRAFLILPDEFTHVDVSDPHGLKVVLPRYIQQAVTLETVDSLVDYVNRAKLPETLLFANISSNVIAALIDYHASAEDGSKAA